ncbi:Imm40 family immunity protein [Sedimentitalea todarodis]|uniref:Imm40 family immunity protein n=1 Tax=Sedimentitalea todarodis TaxID=1631240 RepID=A0ABU3VLG5_9RHOB|nr:Imm40 family immunity protein [Sedimentitalea todarodis]MDU9007017.1 Imm40 family immunity protein [Sedimentitalea todarodis]
MSELGVHNWAFEKAEALEVISKLTELSVPILGGDVYQKRGGEIRPAYDNWYCNMEDGETNSKFAMRSASQARRYVRLYSEPEKQKTLYALVV